MKYQKLYNEIIKILNFAVKRIFLQHGIILEFVKEKLVNINQQLNYSKKQLLGAMKRMFFF